MLFAVCVLNEVYIPPVERDGDTGSPAAMCRAAVAIVVDNSFDAHRRLPAYASLLPSAVRMFCVMWG